MTTQVRVRLPEKQALRLMALPPVVRSRVVGVLVGCALEKVDPLKIVELETTLRNLGTLLNQSLRVSRGKDVDEKSLAEAVQLIHGLRSG